MRSLWLHTGNKLVAFTIENCLDMKRMFISFLVVTIGFTPLADAQSGKKVPKQPSAKQAAAREAQKNKTATGDVVTLSSTNINAAYDTVSARRFSIADPVVNALKQQAAGNTPLVSPSGVVGMPKRAYGFSNGRILLRPTTAPSSGTMYGSGAVGTGTTIMGVGTGENAIGVNGKSPYAGPYLWGSRLPVRNLPVAADTTIRRR
jgi:hypothetical protein